MAFASMRELDLHAASPTQMDANRAHPYRVVSLFSGAMGLDIGLEQAGLKTVVAQDIDPWCVQTIRMNGHVAVQGDLKALLDQDTSGKFLLAAAGIDEQDIFAVVGGPPCQPFSTAGKRLGTTDHRGQLYESFFSVVAALRPRFFVMENVKGLGSMRSDPADAASPPVLDDILSIADRLGYRTVHGVLDAVHYGAPQFRERLVVIGSRDGENVFLPIPSHFPHHQDDALRWKTVGQAISDLGEVKACARFSPNIQKYLSMVPEGGNWRSLPVDAQKQAMGGAFSSGGGKVGFFRRLSSKEPSPTLVTSPVQKATLLAHPHELRPLSVSEYARLQGFPDNWHIEGKLNDCYRQIGNAVPIPLGRAIGQVLVAVAEGSATVRVKRMRGTSVHQRVAPRLPEKAEDSE